MSAPAYLSQRQVEQLLRPIAPGRVSVLEGLSHLEAYDVRAHLNRVFGFGRWSEELVELVQLYEVPGETNNKKPAFSVAYRATVRLTVCAPDGTVLATYTEAAAGVSKMPDFKRGDAHDMAIKTAESQALKRCAVNLGDQFGLSLYRNGSRDAVVTGTLVMPEPDKAPGEGESVDAKAPAVVPEQQPGHEQEPETRLTPPETPPSGETPPPPDGEQATSPEAQALADLAPRMKTVDDLKSGVYDQAKARHLLTASVADPVTGEITQLTRVIAAAKSHLQQATEKEGTAA